MPGQPAATVGSATAHGGTVTSGAPNVLINGQPAARQGDMHVCPLCNPNGSPHAGGPITSGVPNVLIAGQPAATVGSVATCASPVPDTIAQGAPNVLIVQGGSSIVEIGASGGVVELGASGGVVEIGGQGAPSGGGSGAAVQGAQASAQVAAQGSVEATERAEPASRVQFTDASGRAVSGEGYVHRGGGVHSGGSEEASESTVRAHGEVRRVGAEAEGRQEVKLRGFGEARWSKQEARVGEEVEVSCRAYGYADGTEAKVLVYRRTGGSDVLEAHFDAKVSGGKIEAAWTHTLPEDTAANGRGEELSEEAGSMAPREGGPPGGRRASRGSTGEAFSEEGLQVPVPTFVAKVHVHPHTAETPPLQMHRSLDVKVVDAQRQLRKNQPCRLYLADGTIREVQTDAQGRLREEDLPLTPFRIGVYT